MDTLGLICLAMEPTSTLPVAELVRLLRACAAIQAQHNPAVRSFILMHMKRAAPSMWDGNLAECSALMVSMHVYSPGLSTQVQIVLEEDPWAFERQDVKKLIPHFATWGLGPYL